MLKITKNIFAVIGVLIFGYGLVSKNFQLDIMLFFLGLILLVSGLEELQKGRKGFGLIIIGFSLFFSFLIFLSYQGFFLN